MASKDWYIEFENTQGDELSISDLKNATWKVHEVFFDIDDKGDPVFTVRLEIHSLDMLQTPITPQDVEDTLNEPYDWEREDSGVKDDDPEGEEDAGQ